MSKKNQSELKFEKEVVDYLTTVGGVKQWDYESEIKTTDQLWDNFKKILEQNNQKNLNKSLSNTEFNQVKKVITDLATPYKAGQFLYGVNGVSEIEVDLDSGEHVFLTIFDQDQVGAGNTIYQVVNQIERPSVLTGKPNRRFDVTLLINGLPIIQIELKKATHNANESLNQMHQYIAEKQYDGIFSTTQILIAMTPNETRYMANTTLEFFNKDFAFRWQEEKTAKPIYDWQSFINKVLSIPMAHEIATRYMILDGTKNKEMLKVMRPYQVYATKNVLQKVSKHDFKYGEGRLGYVWHTTGSGKTITSFKTAWLASRLPNVNKVVFLVDRIALTNQTVDAYRSYDPLAGFRNDGVVNDTASVLDLHKKLSKSTDANIIVTSIQKMYKYVTSSYFKPLQGNILFIIDEAHRSTGDGNNDEGMLEKIRNAISTSAWVGYTGTPKFPVTKEIFGELLHAYTIKEAIADKNVLGFNVEFKETIEAPNDPTKDEIDDNVKASIYDTSPDHVNLVVKDIFDHWKSRSNNRKYNALFTVHVGGNKASTPRAMEYFDKFNQENEKRPINEQLKVAVSFSMDTSNSDKQLETNDNLHRAIKMYNETFKTVFDITEGARAYTEDVTMRLNKTAEDGNYLDLVIVVDQLLTGFDAPGLNTLYVDRTLRSMNLIQAYSRTNRVHNFIDKPWGNIVNYRWPKENEYEMNEAFAIYSNRISANEQLSLPELIGCNEDDGLLARPFSEVQSDIKEVISTLSKLTDNYTEIPGSEYEQDVVFYKLKEYNLLLSQLKQYTTDDNGEEVSAYDNPETFYERLGITEDEEIFLTTVIAYDLKERRAKRENIDISQVDLSMIHITDVTINYDYLTELIARMADEVHANDMDKATGTMVEIHMEIAKEENVKEKYKLKLFIEKVFNKEHKFKIYPVPRNIETIINEIEKVSQGNNIKLITEFIRRWGLDNCISPKELEIMIYKHHFGEKDMNKRNEINDIKNRAKADYKDIADADIASLSWIKFRTALENAMYELADHIKRGE